MTAPSPSELRPQLEAATDPLTCASLRPQLGEALHDSDPADALRHFQAAAAELARAAQVGGGIPAEEVASLRAALHTRDLWQGEMAVCEVELMFAPDLAGLAHGLSAMAALAAPHVDDAQGLAQSLLTAAALEDPVGPEAKGASPLELVTALLGGILACQDARDLGNAGPWNDLVARLALDGAWFAAAFPAAGAPFLAHVYATIYAPQLPDLLAHLASLARERADELQVSVVDGPDDREATGNHRSLYAVLREPQPLVTVAFGGMSYPGFVLDGGRLRWLGKMNVSILAEENQRLFELACAGHAEGFDPRADGAEGEEGVRAWIAHIAARARDAGAL